MKYGSISNSQIFSWISFSTTSTATLRVIYLYAQTIKSEIITIDNQGYYFSTTYDRSLLLYPDSGISMDEEFVLGDMIWSYNKAEL